MLHLLINWLLSGLSLLIVAAIVPGIEIAGFGTSLIAAIIIGLVNATLGFILRIVAFPLTFVTFGAFLIVINALMLKVAAALMPGFRVRGCLPAIIAAILLGLINTILRWAVFPL
ncbi:MAG TPA: phage holin family protein [Bryobacteraceae bacterium]|nr:phage holin family protein [Bryobacteraceae bacterium]